MYIFKMIEAFIFYSAHFRALGQKSKPNFISFWGKWDRGNLLLKFKVHIFWEGHKMLGNLHCRVDRYYIGQIYSGDLLQKFASFSQYMNFNGLYFEIIFESVCIKIGSFFICRGSAATSGRTPMKNFNIGLLKPSILPPYLWYCPNQ